MKIHKLQRKKFYNIGPRANAVKTFFRNYLHSSEIMHIMKISVESNIFEPTLVEHQSCSAYLSGLPFFTSMTKLGQKDQALELIRLNSRLPKQIGL